MPPPEPSEDEKEDTDPALIEHLTDLRKQLIKSVVVFLVFFIAVFSTINLWFPYVTRGYKLIVLSPLEVISFYTTISAAMAFGLSVPFVCHFLWQFVKPGLTQKEGRFLSLYSPAILILFVGGLAFGYYVVNPLSYNFLVKLGKINFDVMITAKEYARFLLMTTMPIGLLFELPIVALFLSAIGILTSETMKKVRKWSYVILAVVSALITPPDFLSQLIILIPMIALYEASIFIVMKTEKRLAPEAEAS
nr:twin-arginine translocase subunit TatC [Sporosarcina sp. P7]